MDIQLPRDLELNNAFWQFSLNLWQQESAQEVLLRLQDTGGYRINWLLFSMWTGIEKKLISEHLDQISRITDNWHHQIVAPLRSVRKAIPDHTSCAALKPQLQTSELQAEQIEQALLFACANTIPKVDSVTSQLNTLQLICQNLVNIAVFNQGSAQMGTEPRQTKTGQLDESDLLCLVQACLPAHPSAHITAGIEALTGQSRGIKTS